MPSRSPASRPRSLPVRPSARRSGSTTRSTGCRPRPASLPAVPALTDTLHGIPHLPTPIPSAAAPTPVPTPAAVAPLASLLIRGGALKGKRLPVRAPVVNIGRADYNDIVLPEAERQHCACEAAAP